MKIEKSTCCYRVLLVIFFLLIFIETKSQTQKSETKVSYAGIVKYSEGGFGGYDYPKSGDSIIVDIESSKRITLTVFPGAERSYFRHLDISFKNLVLNKKKEYVEIVTPDKSEPTGNYDMEFSYEDSWKGGNNYMINLNHYGLKDAELVIMGRTGEIRITDILIANLVKLK